LKPLCPDSLLFRGRSEPRVQHGNACEGEIAGVDDRTDGGVGGKTFKINVTERRRSQRINERLAGDLAFQATERLSGNNDDFTRPPQGDALGAFGMRAVDHFAKSGFGVTQMPCDGGG
jgi:hypothetical protein